MRTEQPQTIVSQVSPSGSSVGKRWPEQDLPYRSVAAGSVAPELRVWLVDRPVARVAGSVKVDELNGACSTRSEQV